jgi:hypothetical protein
MVDVERFLTNSYDKQIKKIQISPYADVTKEFYLTLNAP